MLGPFLAIFCGDMYSRIQQRLLQVSTLRPTPSINGYGFDAAYSIISSERPLFRRKDILGSSALWKRNCKLESTIDLCPSPDITLLDESAPGEVFRDQKFFHLPSQLQRSNLEFRLQENSPRRSVGCHNDDSAIHLSADDIPNDLTIEVIYSMQWKQSQEHVVGV